MTLPELCDCSENPEHIMPNTNTTPITPASSTGAGGNTDYTTSDNHPNHTNSLGTALKTVLQQASSQGRVTCSLTACVDLLSTRPDDVMLCVMPLLPHPDAAATIQSTLIRAVCLEHNIRILSVDCDVKLAKTVVCSGDDDDDDDVTSVVEGGAMRMVAEEVEEEVDDNCNKVLKKPSACSEDAPFFFSSCDNLAPVMGFPCVLVQYPEDGASTEEEMVAEFCKERLFGHAQQEPYIELPD